MPAPVGGVQAAGRLVGQDDRGPADQGPGDRDPLALAAGQLARPVPGPVREADLGQRVGRGPAPLRRRDAPVQQAAWPRCPARTAWASGRTAGTRSRSGRPGPRTGRRSARSLDGGAGRRGRVPQVGRSSVPAIASRVDLPDPDGPTTAANSPSPIVSVTERSAVTGGDPGMLLARRPAQFQRGHWATTTLVPAVMPGPLTWTSAAGEDPGAHARPGGAPRRRPPPPGRSRRRPARAGRRPGRPARPGATGSSATTCTGTPEPVPVAAGAPG